MTRAGVDDSATGAGSGTGGLGFGPILIVKDVELRGGLFGHVFVYKILLPLGVRVPSERILHPVS